MFAAPPIVCNKLSAMALIAGVGSACEGTVCLAATADAAAGAGSFRPARIEDAN
jgi:hypothetical protein